VTNARTAKSAREKAAELRAEAAKAEARRRTMTITGALIAVIVVVVGAFVLVKTASDNQKASTAAASAPPANLVQGGYLAGNSTAPVTIELYEDFMCPACKQAEDLNDAQFDAWIKEGSAKIIYKPVSILDRFSQGTEYSTRAASAAAAVIDIKPDAFLTFHTLLYANQPAENSNGLTDAQLVDYAVQAGVDKAAIEPAITTQKFKGWVADTTDAFSKAGYTGTPTIVVNGTKVDSYAAEAVKAAVDAAAKK
jgi:protein-disulfide isomerase